MSPPASVGVEDDAAHPPTTIAKSIKMWLPPPRSSRRPLQLEPQGNAIAENFFATLKSELDVRIFGTCARTHSFSTTSRCSTIGSIASRSLAKLI
jgi:hypothetical protein